MNFLKLAILFRNQKFEDKVIFELDNYLANYIDGNSFSASNLIGCLGLTSFTAKSLLKELELIGLIERCKVIQCDVCNDVLAITGGERMLSCTSCGNLVDSTNLLNMEYIISEENILIKPSINFQEKRNRVLKRLETFQRVVDVSENLFLVIVDLRGSTILQKTEHEAAGELIRLIDEEYIPEVLSVYRNYGYHVKSNGDGFMFLFTSAKQSLYFLLDLIDFINKLPADSLFKIYGIKVKGYIHKINDNPKVYLDAQDKIDIRSYQVSKAFRLEKNANLADNFKIGVIVVSVDSIFDIDWDNNLFKKDSEEPFYTEWKESNGSSENMKYYRMSI